MLTVSAVYTMSLLMHLFYNGHACLFLQLQFPALMSCGWLFVSFEKIYQTLESVSHRLSKHFDDFIKNTPLAARRILIQLSINSVLEYPDETLSFVFDMFYI